MTTSVLAKEFERLATRNAQLLHTEEGAGDSIAESREKAEEFEKNLTRLEEVKDLLEKEKRFDELNAWASTPERKAAAFASDDEPQGERRPRSAQRSNPGRALLDHPGFKAYLERVAPNGKISENTDLASAKFDLRNALVTGDTGSGGAFFQTDYQNDLYVPFIQGQLTIRDLVQVRRTDSDVVSYPRAVAHTNVAAEVAEATSAEDIDGTVITATAGGRKPEGEFTWEQVTQAVQPIAEGVPISKRTLMNASELEDIINQQLRYDLEQRLNSQMISGNGTDPNFRGIRNTSGILTQAFSNNVIETLRKGKTKVSNRATGSGRIPNAAVLTPTGMETLDLFRVGGSTTTDGQFLLNPYAERPQRLWGMVLVEEPDMTADKAVVGYFRDAVLWDRQQATVEVFTQHKDFAMRNLVQLLAEWWGAFGVLQPKSFVDCATA